MWWIEICRTIDADKNIKKKKTFTYLPTLLFSTYVTPTPQFFFRPDTKVFGVVSNSNDIEKLKIGGGFF